MQPTTTRPPTPIRQPAYTLAMLRQTITGSVRIFRIFDINIHLHWTWFLLVLVRLTLWHDVRGYGYDNRLWHLAEIVAIFGIILLHEFGHALACRSVGGRAHDIVLWPLGGIAFVNPPPRPGAVLWSIAAGPLVNVVLLPITFAALAFTKPMPLQNLTQLIYIITLVNVVILCFNLLPIYPLDGGQIVQSLLWFILGRATSLRITAAFGFVVAALGAVAALLAQKTMLFVMAVFIAWQAFSGYRAARFLAAQEKFQKRIQAQVPPRPIDPPFPPQR